MEFFGSLLTCVLTKTWTHVCPIENRGRAETKDTKCEKGMGWKKKHIRIKDYIYIIRVKPIKMGRRHRSRHRRRLAAPPRTGPMWRRYDVRWKHFFFSDFFFRLEVVEHTTVSSKPVSGANDDYDDDDGIYKYDKIFVRVSSERDENNIITGLVTLWRLKHNSELEVRQIYTTWNTSECCRRSVSVPTNFYARLLKTS